MATCVSLAVDVCRHGVLRGCGRSAVGVFQQRVAIGMW